MASAPSFNPNHTEDYFSAENSPLMNRAVSGLYPPGSVFKIITAAAALESGRVDAEHQYTCTGSITVNGVKMVCSSKPHGHGTLDMKKAFALSCNCYFVHAAEMTGGREIYEMAQRFGLSSRVFRNFPGRNRAFCRRKVSILTGGLPILPSVREVFSLHLLRQRK